MGKVKKQNTEEIKVKKPLWKRITNGILTGLVVLIIGAIATFGIASLTSDKKANYGVNVIFNHAMLVVLTDSMDPDYPVGSAIFIEKTDPKDIKIGDDLSFYYDSIGMVITHRVSEIKTPSESNSHYTFTLHGINTHSTQCGSEDNPEDCTYQTQTVTEDKVIGKVIGSSVALGKIYNFMVTPAGLLILLLIPGSYLIFVSLKTIVKTLKEDENKDVKVVSSSSTALDSLSEEDKERLKQDLLNELLEEKGKKDE